MKTKITYSIFLSFLLLTSTLFAQTPSTTINYQAVLRDTAGNALSGGNVSLEFLIFAGGNLNYAYKQTMTRPVSQYGVINTEFGPTGVDINGASINLSSLDWANTAFQLQVKADGADLGRKAFGTVPYALSAASSNFTEVDGDTTNEIQNLSILDNVISLSGSTPPSSITLPDEVDGDSTNEIQTLTISVNGRQLTLSNPGGNTVIDLSVLVPAGTIQAYGGTTAPAGWALCNGASVARTGAGFDDLFAAINTNFGAVDATHFNLPDLQGKFLRGVSGSTNNDPDKLLRTVPTNSLLSSNNVGSTQDDAFQGHGHQVYAIPLSAATSGTSTNRRLSLLRANNGPNYDPDNGNFTGTGGTGMQIAYQGDQPASGTPTNTQPSATDIAGTSFGTPRVKTETRPINVYVNYIIKL